MQRRTLLTGAEMLLAAFVALVRGELFEAPDIDGGVRAIQVLAMMMRAM